MPRPTAAEYLQLYAEGWTEGNVDKIFEATHPQFVFYDPDKGAITWEAFPDYFLGFQAATLPFDDTKFMDISGVALQESFGHLLAGVFWQTRDIRGTGLVIVGAQGVMSETVALL